MENFTTQVQTEPVLTAEQIYRQKDAVNYSSLAALAISPRNYIKRIESGQLESDAMLLGSALDCILTQGEEAFHKQYYIMTAIKPESEMMLAYAEEMLRSNSHNTAFNVSGYKKAVSIEKWEKEGEPYYNAIKASKGKKIISFEDSTIVRRAVNSLVTDKYTKEYFEPSEDIEIKYQTPIYWQYENIECKSLLDIIKINHKDKTIMPVDLKSTTKGVLSFKSSYAGFKYYLQAAFYYRAVGHWAAEHYPGYKVLQFRFVVVGFNDINPPMVYISSMNDLKIGTVGGTDIFGNTVKGWQKLITDLIRHKNFQQFDYSWEVVSNNGLTELNLYKDDLIDIS